MPTYGSSVWQGRIRNDPATFNVATAPVDALLTMDIGANNLDHYADSFGQTRINISAAAMTPKKTGVVANTYYQIVASEPFPIPMLPDGTAYKLRLRLGGFSTAGHAVKFAAVLAPVLEASTVLASLSTDSVYVTATTTSATAVYVTGASEGTAAYTTMVELSPDEVARYRVLTSTPVDLAGAASAVEQVLVSLVIFGSTANVASEPTLVNAYAIEWVGVEQA